MQHPNLADRIVNSLVDASREAKVVDVRMGLGYTAVLLADNRAGVAFTFRDMTPRSCTVFHGLRPIAGRPASELLPLLKSAEPIEASVGLACANALNNHSTIEMQTGDILRHLDIGPMDHVGMVGHFRPLVEKLKNEARSLTVFERVPQPTELLRPAEEAYEILPKCQVALITATSIINHTAEKLLYSTRDCREVALLGASTPLCPEVFKSTSVTMLSGVLVQNPQAVMQVVSEGGGMPIFSPHVRKVSLRLKGS